MADLHRCTSCGRKWERVPSDTACPFCRAALAKTSDSYARVMDQLARAKEMSDAALATLQRRG